MIILVQSILRILGVYYLLRTIDSIAYLIMTIGLYYQPQFSDSEMIRTATGLSIVAIIFQLMVAVGLFMVAPKLARLIVGRDKEIPSSPSLDLALVVSSAMLIAAYALVRLFDYAEEILSTVKLDEAPYTLSDADAFHVITSLALILASVLIIKKSPYILRKLREKAEQVNESMPNN